MLQDHIDNTEPYQILIDSHTPLRLVLTSRAMLEQGSIVEPLWHRDAGDVRSFNALLHWTANRRDRWQEWGQLPLSKSRRRGALVVQSSTQADGADRPILVSV